MHTNNFAATHKKVKEKNATIRLDSALAVMWLSFFKFGYDSIRMAMLQNSAVGTQHARAINNEMIITEHDHSKLNVVWRSSVSLHLSTEASYLQEVSF